MHLQCIVVFFLLKTTHACMHVDETTGNCRSLTQSYKWVFFSNTNPDTCVPVSFRGPLVTVLYVVIFCHAPPPFFLCLSTTLLDSNLLHIAYDRIILCVPHLLHFTSHTWTYEGISFKRNSARCRVDILLYLYMYHQFVYTHWFFLSFVKSDEI